MNEAIVRSWKTTAFGIATIVGGVATALLQYLKGGLAAVNWEVLIVAIGAGCAAIAAKDAGVSNSPTPGPAVRVPAAPPAP